MKINYENYAREKLEISNKTEAEKAIISKKIKAEMQKRELHGHIEIIYYSNSALVKLNREYYNMWNYGSGFFSRYVGDYN